MNPHREITNVKRLFKGCLIRIKNIRAIQFKKQFTASKMDNNVIVWALDNHFRGSALKTTRWL